MGSGIFDRILGRKADEVAPAESDQDRLVRLGTVLNQQNRRMRTEIAKTEGEAKRWRDAAKEALRGGGDERQFRRMARRHVHASQRLERYLNTEDWLLQFSDLIDDYKSNMSLEGIIVETTGVVKEIGAVAPEQADKILRETEIQMDRMRETLSRWEEAIAGTQDALDPSVVESTSESLWASLRAELQVDLNSEAQIAQDVDSDAMDEER